MSSQTPPNLDLLYEVVKARVADQSAQIGTLDTKANFGVASSSLLITSVAGLRTAFAAAQQAHAVGDLVLPGGAGRVNTATAVNSLTVAALALFIVLVFCAYKAYQLRRYTVVPKLKVLLDDYWDRSVVDTKADLTTTIADAFCDNEVLIEDKVWWTKAVLACLIMQACLLVLRNCLKKGGARVVRSPSRRIARCLPASVLA